MDTFVEQIVAKKKDGREIALILGVVFAASMIFLATLLFLGAILPLAFLVWCGVGYGAWWLITQQNIEFEYCITNGDIDIDKIIARRKRKRIVSVGGHKIEQAGKYDPARFQGRHFDRFVMAAPSLTSEGLYYFTYHSKKSGSTLVVFQPDERVQGALYKGLQKLVQLDWDKQ